jgi:predicted permease
VIRTFIARVTAMFRRTRDEAGLDEEIRTHLDLLTDEYVRRGMPLSSARAAARREFGGVDQIKEKYRDRLGWSLLDALRQDIRYAFRTFVKNPGFAAVAILTFTIGIGANTAIFGLIDALVLRSLPVRDPWQLVQLKILRRDLPPGESFSHPLTRALSAQSNAVFAGLFGSSTTSFTVGPPDAVTRVRGAWVTGPYFETLGVRPLRGRLLTRADDERGAAPAAVITEAYWDRVFERDPAITDRAMTIEGVRVPIVGVSAGSFGGVDVGDVADITLAVAAMPRIVPEQATMPDDPSTSWLHILARPREGMTRARVAAALAVIWPRVIDEVVAPGDQYTRQRIAGTGLDAIDGATGWTFLRDQFTDPLIVLMALVGLVHLIACTNVANLLLARAAARRREVAIRLAMGAGRARIIRQWLVESALLSLGGAVAGAGLAWLIEHRLVALLSDGRRTPVVFDLSPNWHVWAFTIGTALFTGVAFGLAPAARAAAPPASSALTTGARVATGMRRRLASGLVIAEVAISLLLVIGAGLFVQTLTNLRRLDAGVRREGVLLADLDGARAAEGVPLLRRYQEAARDAARLPGVAATSLSFITPLAGGGMNRPASVNGQSIGRPYFNAVEPRYFATIGTDVVEGREFTAADGVGAPLVAVVNQSFVRRFLPGLEPLGQRVVVRGQEARVVGVVRDAAYESLRESWPPTVYFPLAQDFAANAALGQTRARVTLVVRVAGGAAPVVPALERTLQPAFPTSPLRVRTFSAQIERALIRERLMAALAGSLGVVAILLAAIGLFGLLAYTVASRTSEIGVRLALGAARRQVLWMVISDALRLVVFGVLIGLPASWAASRLIASMLFGLKTTDPVTLAGAASLLLAAGILAASIPAVRATRVDPMVALRHD